MTNASAASSQTLEDKIKAQARSLGFDLVGIAPAAEPASWHYYQDWLAQGYAGQMHYMHHQAPARSHPRHVFPQVRSIILVGLNYKPKHFVSQQPLPAHVGRVSAYAQCRDYHRVLRNKLKQLLRWLQQEVPGCQGRAVVDSAPLLERDFARRAGLGWFGKNTMLINKRLGSFFFLGALLVDAPLKPDSPSETNHCGSCTACLDACPTQALVAPYTLDARRCISYLTIELRGPMPPEMRSQLGDWIFGCDICQDVCPWNRKSPVGQCPELRPRPDLEQLDLYQLFFLSEEEFTRKFTGTPLMRARRDGLLRNAAMVLGNRKDPSAMPALRQGLNDPSPIVRQAAAWALGQIATAEAFAALRTHLPREHHPDVRAAIQDALRNPNRPD